LQVPMIMTPGCVSFCCAADDMYKQIKRGGRVKLQSIMMPLMEFDHPEKGDALYCKWALCAFACEFQITWVPLFFDFVKSSSAPWLNLACMDNLLSLVGKRLLHLFCTQVPIHFHC
jgi:hypothetical protein